jgi:hypothetical protein
MTIFFVLCGLLHTVDGILFIVKDENGTSVQKLTKVHATYLKK